MNFGLGLILSQERVFVSREQCWSGFREGRKNPFDDVDYRNKAWRYVDKLGDAKCLGSFLRLGDSDPNRRTVIEYRQGSGSFKLP